MVRTILSAALLGGTVLVAPAAAQQAPIVQAGASGRYETQLDGKTSVPGFTAAHVAGFRPQVTRVVQAFAAMPQVSAPPAPVCHRLRSWIELNPEHGILGAVVSVMAPISFENGRCHAMTGTGLFVRLNGLSQLADPQEAFVRTESGGDWFLLPIRSQTPRRLVLAGNRVALTHGRAPLFRPVSSGEYLREMLLRTPADPEGGAAGELARWFASGKAQMIAENETQLRELAAMLPARDLQRVAEGQRAVVESTERHLQREAGASRGPSERQRLEAQLAALPAHLSEAPACFDATGALQPGATCPSARTLVTLNPDYFDHRMPDAVQLLVVETPEGRTHGESDARLTARLAIWTALDLAALERLVQ